MPQPATPLQRGIALHRSGDLVGAEREYRAQLAVDPDNADALHLLGLIAYRAGDHREALALVGRALAREPDNPVFLGNLGNIQKDAGEPTLAMQSYRRALALDPQAAGPRNNLGTLLMAGGDLDEALACFRAVLQRAPDHARAWFNLGVASARKGDARGAADALRRAVALQRDFSDAWGELGLALQTQGALDEAVAAFRRRVELSPAAASAHADLALALHRSGALREALEHYERALALDPQALEVRCNLCGLLQQCCDWSALARHWPHVVAAIEAGRPGVPSGLLVAQPGATPALQLAAARANAKRWSGVAPIAHAHAAHERIRVGYLSADFRAHATAYLTAELFELHDRARFEVVLLSYGPDDASAARARLERAADRFVELRGMSDDDAARTIAALEIDVLLDLNGNTDNGRVGIAARRPAPIQVNWLGFPGTLGAPFYDCILADLHVIPPGSELWYSERVVRLPDCYQCNDRRRPRPHATLGRAELGLADDAVVLCCFNQAFKTTADVFDAWLRVLSAVPATVLWLLEDNAVATEALRAHAMASGIDPQRLVFAPRCPLEEHLARYRVSDLAVDTFPCTSHTTASDALWQGCPLVTMTGETFAARVATSLVRNAGVGELATADLAAYEALIVDLARDSGRRDGLRRRLEQARASEPLFDTPRFTRNLEATLSSMAASSGTR
jgi:predicted O-linked N-acetylglucosamine transferase (SPINDLY family)